ncbi:hypothetical protein HPB51_020478 [Rhipicephalus microplus]|uniref:Phosphoribulokinase/uridine kinase domain-containing protein n=1 Tax=Rhipicephalus microplus TaxID=6941 RepID=A0A9J6EI38_RHIMP|nr:hypothetical protein HPB51_020478 [Rhipicephalus microplus]
MSSSCGKQGHDIVGGSLARPRTRSRSSAPPASTKTRRCLPPAQEHSRRTFYQHCPRTNACCSSPGRSPRRIASPVSLASSRPITCISADEYPIVEAAHRKPVVERVQLDLCLLRCIPKAMSEECGSEVNAVGYYSFSGFDTKTPFLIGVAGGTASGKTSVCRKIMSRVGQEGQVVCIHQDNFYKGLSPFERDRANRGLFNYDHPADFLEDDDSKVWECRGGDTSLRKGELFATLVEIKKEFIPRGGLRWDWMGLFVMERNGEEGSLVLENKIGKRG